MDFGITDEDQMIVDALTTFGAEQLRPSLRAHEAARAVSPELAGAFADMGFERLELPESLGGAGLGMLSRVLANIALARADAALALIRIDTRPDAPAASHAIGDSPAEPFR